MDKLFSICDGWTTNGNMICSADPKGGIIETVIRSPISLILAKKRLIIFATIE